MKKSSNETKLQVTKKGDNCSSSLRNSLTPSGTVAKVAVVSALVAVTATVAQRSFASVTINASGTVSAARTQARDLFKALTAIGLPIDDPRLVTMEADIARGDQRSAAKVATGDPLFYDVRVRDMAKALSTQSLSVRAPLSDFVATFVGVVRDSDTTSAKTLLTGNFTYVGDPNKTTVAGTQMVAQTDADFLTSNQHYDDLTKGNFSLYDVLTRKDGQRVVSGDNGSVMAHPDPAGLITSYAFQGAHAFMGTNRRLVQYSMEVFMCVQMKGWADPTAPDNRVGRDVDRVPSGSSSKYLQTCKACHGQMDGFRGAFSHVDFNNNTATYSTRVEGKMNRNNDVFPGGFVMGDDSFLNYANEPANQDQFGWRSANLTGNGMGQFAAMIADSQGFSRCMVRHVFTSVCKHTPSTAQESLIRSMATDFENDSYNFRNVFERVAIHPQCLNQ